MSDPSERADEDEDEDEPTASFVPLWDDHGPGGGDDEADNAEPGEVELPERIIVVREPADPIGPAPGWPASDIAVDDPDNGLASLEGPIALPAADGDDPAHDDDAGSLDQAPPSPEAIAAPVPHSISEPPDPTTLAWAPPAPVGPSLSPPSARSSTRPSASGAPAPGAPVVEAPDPMVAAGRVSLDGRLRASVPGQALARVRAFAALVVVVLLAGVGVAVAIGAAVAVVAFLLQRTFE